MEGELEENFAVRAMGGLSLHPEGGRGALRKMVQFWLFGLDQGFPFDNFLWGGRNILAKFAYLCPSRKIS